MVKIGVPQGLLFHRYEGFLRAFFDALPVEAVYSGRSSQKLLHLGTENCVDEACLPVKLFHGHVKELSKRCDCVAVPRIMHCEYGESICPKFSGLPELIQSSMPEVELAFSSPLHLHQKERLLRSLVRDGAKLGLSEKTVKRAAAKGMENQRNTSRGLWDAGYSRTVLLAGHPYNVYDSFANRGLIEKLHRQGVGVITAERISALEKRRSCVGFIKQPYWLFFLELYGAAAELIQRKAIHGIVYVSSFSCGTDAFTVPMLQNRFDIPMLVVKVDEQTGEAGLDTRIEAFCDLLGRKGDRGASKFCGGAVHDGIPCNGTVHDGILCDGAAHDLPVRKGDGGASRYGNGVQTFCKGAQS